MKWLLLCLSIGLFSCNGNPEETPYSREWKETDRNFLIENLNRTYSNVVATVDSLSTEQWNWRPSAEQWSIAEIVEHLIIHDELFYREMRALHGLPSMAPQPDSLFSDDKTILNYREITSENTGKSPNYMEPLGRWCSREDAMSGYDKVRTAMIQFVTDSNKDFRKYYTTSGRGPTKFRDLHQLLLISIAHTERHTQQIKEVLSSPGFPE